MVGLLLHYMPIKFKVSIFYTVSILIIIFNSVNIDNYNVVIFLHNLFFLGPRRIVLVTLVALGFGYKFHEFETNLPQLMKEAQREHVFAPKSREMLLTYQAMVRKNQEKLAEGGMNLFLFFIVSFCLL